MDDGQLAEARAVFDRILVLEPGNSGALYQKGVTLVRMNDYANGILLIEQAVQLAPDILVYKKALASMYEFSGRMPDALNINREIMAATDVDSEDYSVAQRNVGFITATMLAQQGKMQQAEQQFYNLSIRYPDDFMIRYSLGIALMFQGKVDAAEESLLMTSVMNPDYVNAYLSLATLYEKQGRLSQAYEVLARVVKLDAGKIQVDRARVRMFVIEGDLLMAEGNAAEAQAVFDQARDLEPENPEVLLRLGLLYEQTGDWSGAVEVNEHLLRLQPERMDARLRLANAYNNVGQPEQAAAELEHIMRVAANTVYSAEAQLQLQRLLSSSAGQLILDRRREAEIVELQAQLVETPGDMELLRSLTTLLLQQQRWEDARIPLQQLLEKEPATGLTHISLALVYDKLGQYDNAIKPYAYGISLESNPDMAEKIVPSLLMVVAKASHARGDLHEAKRLFSEILQLQPGNSEARFYAGLVFSALDQIVEAIDAFQRVLKYEPGNIGARLNLAMSYHQLKREEEAIEEFRNALQYSSSGPLSDQITEQMRVVEKSIHGFSGGISYVLAYDDNSNLNDDNPLPEYRTDLAPQLFYRYKSKNGLRWLLSTEPSYSSYHNGQFDFLNTRSSVAASVSKGKVTMSGGVSYQVSLGLVNSRRSSNSTTTHAEWSGRFKLPVIVRPTDDERVLTNATVRISYTEFDSLGSAFFSAYNYSAIASLNQPVAERTVLNLSYRSTLSENMHVEGSDYAFRGNGIDVRLERGLAAGVSINGGYSLTVMDYLYPDSVSGYTRYRHSQSRSLALGVNYQFHRSLRLFTNVVWSSNQSNLPAGLILNAQDVVEGQQSPSLGDYNRITLSAGISLSL